jgi:hypothetical protein
LVLDAGRIRASTSWGYSVNITYIEVGDCIYVLSHQLRGGHQRWSLQYVLLLPRLELLVYPFYDKTWWSWMMSKRTWIWLTLSRQIMHSYTVGLPA